MNLLAIDTSTEQASVALLAFGTLSFEAQGSPKTHAQLLLPMIDRLMSEARVTLPDLDGIIFGCGPGSFTGLRIACSIAKGLAYAHDLDLIPVSSLAAIACAAREALSDPSAAVLAVLDARMHELYWAYYPKGENEASHYVNKAQDIHAPVSDSLVLAGVGINLYEAELSQALQAQLSYKLDLYPDAAAMIRLVQAHHIPAVSVAKAQPIYVRNQVTQGESRG